MRTTRYLQLAAVRFAAAIVVCAGLHAQTPAAPTNAEPPFRLSPGDTIDVRLFFNPELNESAQIRPDGYLSLHVAGEVLLAGKTVAEASTMLEDLYKKEIRTPRVLIQVRSYAARKIYITGEVLKPGLVNIAGPMTVLDAIGEAGGVKNTGDRKLAVLIRKGADGKPEGRKVALFIHGTMSPEASTQLRPFDVVMIPESRIARIDRWVDQHIRQLIPINASAGFTYLTQGSNAATIPIF
ncbi:polysaccharide biosynthesis/export family protein [uncultured Paludibaculum sp.]|uniref:polysaccharide biosynthesis/export family protein n=1 Tax=uncultured Paludibaculum sp. TaxID=1765020 RepID=UPI002AAADFFF|nr:polysaccharide biosynthesis/export family protein [uncultured Paludibaculum sp.]